MSVKWLILIAFDSFLFYRYSNFNKPHINRTTEVLPLLKTFYELLITRNIFSRTKKRQFCARQITHMGLSDTDGSKYKSKDNCD